MSLVRRYGSLPRGHGNQGSGCARVLPPLHSGGRRTADGVAQGNGPVAVSPRRGSAENPLPPQDACDMATDHEHRYEPGKCLTEASRWPPGGAGVRCPVRPPPEHPQRRPERRQRPLAALWCAPRAAARPSLTRRPASGSDAAACRARRMWADARTVSANPDSPARRWAALRKLWRPGDPFPPSLRWLAWRDGGGSLVACFAPLGDWLDTNPEPSGVQLIHIAPNGQPRRDRGGLGKRSHGTMGGSVVLMGDSLSDAGRIHVAEGVADALAVAAREEGAVIAAGGTSGFARLSRDLSRLGLPVVIWPDGDEAGKKAACDLECALRERGAIADTARIPGGHDPASMAGSCFDGPGRWSYKENS